MDESKYTKLSDLKGLQGAPNVPDGEKNPDAVSEQPTATYTVEEMKQIVSERLAQEVKEKPVNVFIPKKSFLAVIYAFQYKQNPEFFNTPETGAIDLQGFLNNIFRSLKAGDTELLKDFPDGLSDVESLLTEMTDDEIVSTIESWKESAGDDEESKKKYDEYLAYLLESEVEPAIPEVSSEFKEVAAPALTENPETELKIESITIDESRLPYKLKAVIAGKEKTPYYIYLSPVAQVASPEELKKYVEACRQVLVETNGKFYPRFAVEKGKLVVGVGPNGKIDNWQEIDTFSVEELVNITEKSKPEVEKYLALRIKKFTSLTDSEKKERGDFEDVLNRSKIQFPDFTKTTSFKEAIQSKTVLDTWIEAIGEKRFEKLVKTPLPAQPERNINRWSTDEEHFNSAEFQAKAQGFMNLIKARFDSLEKALGYKSILSELSQQAGLKGTEALYLLGKEALSGDRQEYLGEYQRLYNLSMDVLKEYLKDHPLAEAPENETMTKAKILKYSLLGYVRAKPLPTDLWRAKKVEEAKPVVEVAPQVIKVASEPVVKVPAVEVAPEAVKPAKKELKYVEEIFGTEEIGSDKDGLFGSLSDEALDRISKALS